jgi:hypothetical protein
MKINTPKVIDTQMRMPDASSFTWRTKMAATVVNRRTDHVMNNVQDPNPAPTMNSKAAMSYVGTGFGGKVQDASSYTMSLSARSLGKDVFNSGPIKTVTKNIYGDCLASTPASQVVGERGNSDGNVSGLNMGYTRINGAVNQVGRCTSTFYPLTESQFVDTIPDIKNRKIGVQNASEWKGRSGTNYGSQNAIMCKTTTSGNIKNEDGTLVTKDVQANMLFSEPPTSSVKALFVTSPTGPQVGGGDKPGSRAPKVGGPVPLVKRVVNHRGWANPSRNPYPFKRIPPTGTPAHLKINDPNHYKV